MAETTSFTRASIIQQAKAEVTKELGDKHKERYKHLLKEREAARRVLANIDRQIEDYELQMEQELGA